MLEAGVSAFELGECLHVRFVSFCFALKGFAWRQTAARCFTVSQSPKTLSCARVWLKKKTECYTLCFSHIFQGFSGSLMSPSNRQQLRITPSRRSTGVALCSNFCLLRKSCEYNELFIWILVRALFQALLGALSAKRGQTAGYSTSTNTAGCPSSLLYPCFKTALCYSAVSGCFVHFKFQTKRRKTSKPRESVDFRCRIAASRPCGVRSPQFS